ncbi:hypothetical protein J2TS4_51560 [Paenibacillus sp. J2TS4]|nr:hypothetical protein J2TS4_51560 [Paenibacillus sp. J2TS4]
MVVGMTAEWGEDRESYKGWGVRVDIGSFKTFVLRLFSRVKQTYHNPPNI